jgi:hypothetical protein
MTNTAEHTHCHRCGRSIRSAVACARKYGSGCWAIVRKAAKAIRLAAFTARQVDQAIELIEDVAIVPAGEAGLFYAVSSDGTEIYRTTRETCDCPASKECYHEAAVLMLTASAA